jgi:CBS domain-containing protein
MSCPAITAPETLSLPIARSLMQRMQIRRLPVVDATGQLIGIVSEGDINRISASPTTDVREYNVYYTVARLPLREFMTRNVAFVTPETPVVEVARLLFEHRVGGLPVVQNNRVVGMITESDLFRRMMEAEAEGELVARAAAG